MLYVIRYAINMIVLDHVRYVIKMKYNCRNCHYYNKEKGFCNYYKDDVPFILNNSCKVWARKMLRY